MIMVAAKGALKPRARKKICCIRMKPVCEIDDKQHLAPYGMHQDCGKKLYRVTFHRQAGRPQGLPLLRGIEGQTIS
jgi:hypothetical protein